MRAIVMVSVAVLVCAAAGCKKPRITSPTTSAGRMGEPFTYQITATRNPSSFGANVPPPDGLSVNTSSGLITGVPNQSGEFVVTLSARNAAGERNKQLSVTISPLPAPPTTPHAVVSGKELFVIAPAVLNSPEAQSGGAWHIRSALQRIAGTGQDVEAFAQSWFATWAVNTLLPGINDTFRARPWVTTALQQAWQADRIKLIAIVNRIDLTRFQDGDITKPVTSLGEGRFVYEVRDAGGQSLPFTIIFEYKLPALGDTRTSLESWAKRWHALGRVELGGANDFPQAYLDELKAITDEYSAHGNLNQIRANEFLPPTSGPREWELREFHFVDGPARLVQVPVAVTPAFSHNNSAELATFINAEQGNIIASGLSSVPASLQGAVSPVPSPSFGWSAPGASVRATFIASFNTCSGCHAGNTQTLFQHVGANAPQMSSFLRGPIPLSEPLPPATNTSRTHDEMSERRRLLAAFSGDLTGFAAAAFNDDALSKVIKARANRAH